MEKVKSIYGEIGKTKNTKTIPGPLYNLAQKSNTTVQEVLLYWYNFLKAENRGDNTLSLFPATFLESTGKSLKSDLAMMPAHLMGEIVNDKSVFDKGQYIRLVQALLVNISDLLFTEKEELSALCIDVEELLPFLQDFFYQYFDYDYRITNYHAEALKNSLGLKLDYWRIKLQQPLIIEVLHDCLNWKTNLPESHLTFRKVVYLSNLFQQLEASPNIITTDYIRDLFIYYDFNDAGFVEHEKILIRDMIADNADAVITLKKEQLRINKLKIKTGFIFETNQPSLKYQLSHWITAEIKEIEINKQSKEDKHLALLPEEKIQTSLSVAKLAVIIRLLIVDKIIINKSVAPMLRTIAKLFTTLQKDEISFGSLETKYHAPDKATLNIMKEMIQKWANLVGKL